MWQKVDPRGFRTGIVRWWTSEYFAPTKKLSAEYMVQDLKVRNYIDKFYKYAGISKVVFRKGNNWEETKNDILIFTAKPGLILWKEWKRLEQFKKSLTKQFKEDFEVMVKEIWKPELSARVMADHISSQIEKRMHYRRVIKSVVEKVMAKWAEWIKVNIAGRLNGAEMARSETFKEWRIPLQTLRADVDYYYVPSLTKYGILGIKVWIYKWDIEENATKKTSSRKDPRKTEIRETRIRKTRISK